MQTWVTVVIPLAVAILTVAVNAVVNIKIKFAPNAEVATRELKALALRVLQWLLNLVMVGTLINNVVSREPVTRFAVFTIALQVAALCLIAALYLIERIIGLVQRMVEVQTRHLDVTKVIQDALSSRQKGDD